MGNREIGKWGNGEVEKVKVSEKKLPWNWVKANEGRSEHLNK